MISVIKKPIINRKNISFFKKNIKPIKIISSLKNNEKQKNNFAKIRLNLKIPPFKPQNIIPPLTLLIFPQYSYAYSTDFTLFVQNATPEDISMFMLYNFIMWQLPMIILGRVLNLPFNHIAIQLVFIGLFRCILLHNQ